MTDIARRSPFPAPTVFEPSLSVALSCGGFEFLCAFRVAETIELVQLAYALAIGSLPFAAAGGILRPSERLRFVGSQMLGVSYTVSGEIGCLALATPSLCLPLVGNPASGFSCLQDRQTFVSGIEDGALWRRPRPQ